MTNRKIVVAIAAAVIIIAVIGIIYFRQTPQNTFAPNPRSHMKKVTSYEIHLSVATNGKPISGYIKYKLDGDPAEKRISSLVPAEIATLTAILAGDEAYFDDNLNEFVRHN